MEITARRRAAFSLRAGGDPKWEVALRMGVEGDTSAGFTVTTETPLSEAQKDDEEILAWAISWTESEAGWGQRPDGWSFHHSKDDLNKYVKNYTKDRVGPTPNLIKGQELADKLCKGLGTRAWSNKLPEGVRFAD